MIDLRLPTGSLFALLGLMLCAAGLTGGQRPLLMPEVNINLWSGLSMLLFAAVMLGLAYRSKRQRG
jgi:hypothetical protein